MISHGKHDPRVFEIHIKTEDCVLKNNQTTEFDVSLEASIVPRANHFLSVSLSSASIPFSWYNFSKSLTSNKIAFDSDTFEFAEGNYDIDELCALLTSEASFPFSCLVNYNTAKVTLTNTDASQHTLRFSDSSTQGLVEALGFNETDRDVAPGSSVVSDGTINMNVVTALFLYTDLAIDNVISTSNGGNYSPILEKIELFNVTPFGIIQFSSEQTIAFHAKMQVNEIRHFSMSLRDQNGRLIDLNNQHFELSIHIKEKVMFMEEQEVGEKRRRVENQRRRSFAPPIPATPAPAASTPAAPPTPKATPSPMTRSMQPTTRRTLTAPAIRQAVPPRLTSQNPSRHTGSSLSKNAVELQNAVLAAHLLDIK